MKINKKVIFTALVTVSSLGLQAQDTRFTQKNPDKPEATEFMDPEVRVVTPSTVPSDAIVLFDGKNLEQWESTKDGSAAKWKVEDGVMTVVGGAGGISTKKLLAIVNYTSNGVHQMKQMTKKGKEEEIVVFSYKEFMKCKY